MAEDLKSKMAAIHAAKAERAKKHEDEKKSAEMDKTRGEAEKENTLHDRAKELEATIVNGEQGAQQAEAEIQQAQGMLAEGELLPEEQAMIEDGIREQQQKIEELNNTRIELADIKAQIEQLNAKSEAGVEPTTETENTTEPTEAKITPELPEKLKMKLDGALGDLEGKERIQPLLDLIEEFDKKPEQAKDLLENVGVKVIEILKKQFEQRQKGKPEAKMLNMQPFKELGGLVREMQRFTPDLADKYSEFILQETTKSLAGNKPDEIRSALFINNSMVYAAMENVNTALALDRPISDGLKKSVAEVLPILEASDKSETKNLNNSRFLTKDFIARRVEYYAPRGTNLDELRTKIQEGHKKIQAEYKS